MRLMSACSVVLSAPGPSLGPDHSHCAIVGAGVCRNLHAELALGSIIREHPMRARLVRLCVIAWIMCAGACTSWSRVADNEPVPARGTIQVWSAGRNTLLHKTRTLGDSLAGKRPAPDTTRVAVALSAIDSLRTQTPDFGKMFVLGVGVGVAVFYAIVHSPAGE
jgi:hypothetical protein